MSSSTQLAPPPPPVSQRIKALDEAVVNRIAAGEIIVAPVNALKELIENSVDAGATSVEIAVKDGGLKLLQITDNGHGINRDDMAILCERFTTSKLKSFEDLASMTTYGFRGEALASISMIAHLTVTTKTKDSNCAWRAVYADGKLAPPKPGQSADPKPVAGRQGTQITVEDLFYNTPSRRRAFRSPGEEYSKILDVVGRYAVHCDGVAFSCKKYGESDVGLSTASNAALRDRIRRVHGSSVANELIDLEAADKHLGFQAKGMLSNANYHVKKTTLLLFINGRSVESSSIKKALDTTYSSFLPKGGHPFVYLALDIEPSRVDVNVHPTKREVNFLHEDEIIETICAAVQEKLAAVDTSRSYTLTQTLLPGTQLPGVSTTAPRTGSARSTSTKDTGPAALNSTQPRKSYENNTVRVDSRDRKITSMLQPAGPDSESLLSGGSSSGGPGARDPGEYEYDDTRHWEEVRYASVRTLRKEVRESVHNGLADLFGNHIFVGLVDDTRRLAAVQHGVKLYLVDYGAVCFELFYQIGLSDFRNYGVIRLNPPLAIRDILELAVKEEQAQMASLQNPQKRPDPDQDVTMEDEETSTDMDWEGVTETVESLLLDHRVMLRDYFSLDINDEGELVSLPLLLKGYTPSMGKLPSFLLRLGPNVVWDSETECFSTFLRELALFYVPESLAASVAVDAKSPPDPNSAAQAPEANYREANASAAEDPEEPEEEEEEKNIDDDEDSRALAQRRQELKVALEDIVFPAFRKRLIPTNELLASVTEIANLKGLYRVFERSC